MTDPAPEATSTLAGFMAMSHSDDPANKRLAAGYLEEQIELTRVQRATLLAGQASGALNTQKLMLENRFLHMQSFREALRAALDICFILLIAALVLFCVAMIWGAATSRAVVIGQFDVPPSFESQGLTGKVVASSLLDRLQALQNDTRTPQTKRHVQDAWSGAIQVQIPQAHISISELQNYLHQWLGRDVQISGNIVATETGVSLSVRGTGFPSKSFEGRAGDMPQLLTKAAEYLYGQSEPYLFEAYLTDTGRDAEAIEVAKASYLRTPKSDRPLVLNTWGNALEDLNHGKEALDKFREAVRLDPHFWSGYNNIMYAQLGLGQEEEALQTGLVMERVARRGRWFPAEVRDVYWQNLDGLRQDLMAEHREQGGDLAASNGFGTAGTGEEALDAQNLAQMHDHYAAELQLEAAGNDTFAITQSAFVRGLIAFDRAEYAKALKQFEFVDAQMAKSTTVASQMSTSDYCWIGLAQEFSGESKNADANIARGGHFVDCYRFKADILDHRGKWSDAQIAYASAVSLATSLPNAYDSWGEALARHGDFKGAITKLAQAHLRGPHWADPLEHWAEVEARMGAYDSAARHYQQAARYAPHWATLLLLWGRALDKLDRHDEALAKFRQAWSLDLSANERRSIYGCCH